MRIGRDPTTRAFAALAGAAALLAATALGAGAGSRPIHGSLDRSFAGDGRKLIDLYDRRDAANAVAIDDRGRTLVGGSTDKGPLERRALIIRLRGGGRLDRSFAGDGVRLLTGFGDGQVGALAIQPNGKIVAAGDDNVGGLAVARVRPDGRSDRSFAGGGSASVPGSILPGRNAPHALAIQPNGRIVVAGRSCGGGQCYLVVARFTRHGLLDRTFAGDGVLMTTFGYDTYARGFGLALQDDGRIVISGDIGNGWFVGRLLPDGSLDPSFGNSGGLQLHDPVGAGQAYDVAIQPDGRIVAAGADYDGPGVHFGVARYLPDGSPDSSFGGGEGAVRTTFRRPRPSDQANALALQQDGRIVAVGTTLLPVIPRLDRSPLRFAVVRYRQNGSLDRSFSGDGKVITSSRPGARKRPDDQGLDVAQLGRKIVVVGTSWPWREDINGAVVRYRR